MNLEKVLEIISNIVEYHNKNLTKKQYFDLLECKEYLQKNSIATKDKIYVINVVDFEDGNTILNLAYDNEKDYHKANEIIYYSKCEWYEKEIDYCMSEYIEEKLIKENLLGLAMQIYKNEV